MISSSRTKLFKNTLTTLITQKTCVESFMFDYICKSRCRMLQIQKKGDHIRIPAFNSINMDSCTKAAYEWPTYNSAPSAHNTLLWQRTLRLTVTGGVSMSLLRQYTFGCWKHSSRDHIKWWEHDNDRVYSQREDTWQKWVVALKQRATRARGRQYASS